MKLQKIIKLKNMDHDKSVVERLVEENITGKLDKYLQKFEGDDIEWSINISVEKSKKDLFKWVLQINIDGKDYRFEREDYKKLDDLINHLFDKFKEDLSDK